MEKKRKFYSVTIASSALLALPAVSMAALQDEGGIDDLMNTILGWLDTAALMVMALAFLFFLWGLAKFILNAGDPEERGKGQQIMLWGIIAFVVMTSLWAIVDWLGDTFIGENGEPPTTNGFQRD